VRTLSRAATAFGLLGLVLAILGGALLGTRLGAAASEPGTNTVHVADPELSAGAPAHARRTAGGFTGFGSAALPGEVIAGGELVSMTEDGAGGTLVFRDGGRETSIRYTDSARLFELVAGGELAVGDTVVLQFDGDAVIGVLRIPFDLGAERAAE